MSSRKVIIIGAGIAGLCSAVLARNHGYQVQVLEQHDSAGGLATSWRRGDYTFENCLHWLTGTNPRRGLYPLWREVFDIERLSLVYQPEFARIETASGERLPVFSNIDRMEAELLRLAPEDAAEVRRFAAAGRGLIGFPMPDPSESRVHMVMALLRMLPYLPLLRRWSKLSVGQYGQRFNNKLLRAFFDGGETANLSVIALLFSLAWMHDRDGAYVVGGSQAIIRLLRERLERLGGSLRLRAKVEKILVEDDTATGVRLSDGETLAADWVISAADAHATIYDMLGGTYADASVDRIFHTLTPFPSYLLVSFGVARDLSTQPGFVTYLLDHKLAVDPGTELTQLGVRFFNFDPSFAPPGKTAVTGLLPTRNAAFWTGLQQRDPTAYRAEKQRVQQAVLAILEARVPDVRGAIEVADVATPATIVRYTGNWQGSMEGWLLTPGMGLTMLRNTLPRLRRFRMVGQWIMPGGGLPSGLLTARVAVRALCREDGIAFVSRHQAQSV